jgi:exonuclease SbcD
MKIIHTSDWHLGKKLYRISRTKEQAKFLEWFSSYIRENKVDILLISGDIFDVPTPPNEALKVYFDFLKSLTDQCEIQIFIIAGNHDSSNFLMAPAPFLINNNIHICGNLNDLLEENYATYTKEITINNKIVSISMFPYFRTHELFNLAKKWDINIDEGALPVISKIIEKIAPKGDQKKILMSHHLFGSYEEAGSELGLSLSGVESIPTKLLTDFDYVALGHIHKSQTISKESPIIHYSGSPMAFRFSETTMKTFSEITIKNNNLNYELIQIKEFDKLLRVTCSLEELDQRKKEIILEWSDSDIVVYVEIKLKTTSPVTGIIESLREELRESGIILLSFQTIIHKSEENKDDEHFLEKSLSTEDLFKLFYKKKYPESTELPKELDEDFQELLNKVREVENEITVD